MWVIGLNVGGLSLNFEYSSKCPNPVNVKECAGCKTSTASF